MLKFNAPYILSLGDQVVSAASNLVSTILIGRLLGVENFGILSLYLMFMYFVVGVKHALVNVSLLNDVGKANNRFLVVSKYMCLDFYINTVFFLILIVAFFLAGALGFRAEILAVLMPILFCFGEFCRRSLYAINRAKFAFILTCVKSLSLLVMVLIVFLKRDEITIVQGINIYFLSSLLYAAASIFLIIKAGIDVKLDYADAKMIWVEKKKYSLWLFYGSILSFLKENFVALASGLYLGTAFVGGVRSAQTLMGVFQTAYMALENVIPVKAAKIYKKFDDKSLFNYLAKVYLIIIIMFFPFFCLMYFGSNMVLAWLYGVGYAQYDFVLKIFVFIYLVYFTQYLLSMVFRVRGQTKFLFYTSLISSLASLVGYYPAVMYLGEKGALLSLLFSSLAGLATTIYYVRKVN